MIKSNNSYSKLKEVIVGRELEISKRIADFTFKHFYNSNLNNSIYENFEGASDEYKISHKALVKRNLQLDNLATTLENLGIIVHRPDRLKKVVNFSTPDFKSELSSASNVRDLTLVMGDKLIETPTYVQNRYFENTLLYDVYSAAWDYGDGGQWIRCPHTTLTKDTIDLEPWDAQRDYENFDKSKYVMAIDGAQFLRINDDVIVNVNSYNHYLGYLWVKSFFPDKTFHIVHMADNHIDGDVVGLNATTFLVNPKHKNIVEQMPDKFKDCTFLIPEDIRVERSFEGVCDVDIQIASERGMDINVLSIDENTVLVHEGALGTIKILKDNGFKVIPIELDNCEIFGGGIHCSTLDLVRE